MLNDVRDPGTVPLIEVLEGDVAYLLFGVRILDRVLVPDPLVGGEQILEVGALLALELELCPVVDNELLRGVDGTVHVLRGDLQAAPRANRSLRQV